VETTSGGKRHCINALASEVARHQQVEDLLISVSTPAASTNPSLRSALVSAP
jgi:hypothetical protein